MLIHDVKFGRLKIVALITLFSIVASELITMVSLRLFDSEIDEVTIFLSALVPALVAPCASWYIVGLSIKINQLKEELQIIASYDKLTGTMTRTAFLNSCESVYDAVNRKESSLAIYYIDVDDFKKINDTYGHPGGDAVLKAFGEVLQNCLRKSDMLGRIGGEEFAVVLPHISVTDALKLAEKLLSAIKQSPVFYSGLHIPYSVSIGITPNESSNKTSLEQLFKQADHALYQAKLNGKACVAVFLNE
ncbi:GGDEF domain-containing protein [Methylocucumis oryzae]|uniref:GGDEF domain-containing protein n=1 Tax=Methylocucumis oryzae TaxID=1632867 RepID=UPI000A7F672D|nr:GGDEF domain-containing protein [Methylocucumis oryzae]